MQHLTMQTKDITDENIAKLKALFPNAVTEVKDDDGNIREAIDFDVLRQELSHEIVEGREERYQFTWPDKKKAMLEANTPINKTLRPVVEDSVGKDGTPGGFDSENLYIEGDNLDVLKLLRETYLGKIKMIYIDPPYNTGNDFIYDDDFAEDSDEFKERNFQFDELGNRMVQNTESNGRFHTDWLNMMYPRLKLAKDLLSDDGVIFISIDDNEVENLKKICDEVFGEINIIGIILWKKKTNGNNMGFIPSVHDYIVCYSKSIVSITDFGYTITDEYLSKTFSNPDSDPRGAWTTTDLSANHKGPSFPIINPNTGEIHYPPQGRYWVFNEEEVKKRIIDGRIIFGKSGKGKPVQKVFAENRKFGKIRAESWWDDKGFNSDATEEQRNLFGIAKLFTHPKPSKLIYNLLKISIESEDLVLDFFSGSATTAHAVMQLNAEDGGHRKYIMVQLPELTDEKSEAYKAGYKNICEISKERIRRAGRKIKQDSPLTTKELDVGFRCLRIDSSNMKDVYYRPKEYTKDLLNVMEGNIKPDRSPMDLLFQVMLDLGISLSSPIEKTSIQGKEIFNVDNNILIACFDDNIDESVITAIAKQKPYYFVMRDSGMASDSVAANFEQIFETFSRDTVRRVL